MSLHDDITEFESLLDNDWGSPFAWQAWERLKAKMKNIRNNTIQECVELSDTIERQYTHTEIEEWKAFKHFRNTLRDNNEIRNE